MADRWKPALTRAERVETPMATWRRRMHEVIFEADTPEGRLFDLLLLASILLSVVAVSLESVEAIQQDHGAALRIAEWCFTLLFTGEYALRLLCVGRPLRYALSFYGLVDLLSVLPTYLSLLLPGAHTLVVIRALRLLRVFRVLKFARYLKAANVLYAALRSSWPRIVVFLGTVLTLVTIISTLMYLFEGKESGFSSIPRAMYWAIVTMTTVGYGDIAPQTVPGQVLAALVMILGYSIIVVPTGIVSADLVGSTRAERVSTQVCPQCATEGHATDARFCKSCGARL